MLPEKSRIDIEDILKDEQISLLAKRGCRAKNRVRSPANEKKLPANVRS